MTVHQTSGVCLLVDIGNQRAKWSLVPVRTIADAGSMDTLLKCLEVHTGVFNLESFRSADQSEQEALLSLLSLRPDRIIVSTVAADADRRRFEEICERDFQCEPEYITSPKEAAGLSNEYEESHKLGVDRWLAGLAAWYLLRESDSDNTAEAVVVIDAGTAVTVDLVSHSRFEGGVIMPGMTRMIEVLGATTGKIDIDARNIIDMIKTTAETPVSKQNLVPGNTQDAVRHGAFLSVSGGINAAIENYESHLGALSVVITGGDSAILAPAINRELVEVPHLVLAGLAIQSMGALQ